MSASSDKAANRRARRAAKAASHEPLLRLVEQETHRRSVPKGHFEITPLTEAQRLYDNAIRTSDIILSTGPAGTGKTWFAAMRAAEALANREIERIVVTRPAVAAEEELGFLPGDLDEKNAPYFRPVRDALEEFFGTGHLEYLLKSGTIEARPLGLLRGSTIKNTWLIADEMQNATKGQTKMLLTRIGPNSKFIINGDPSQCDLPNKTNSGLYDAVKRLRGVKGISFVHFTRDDIVRHGIVQAIVDRYSEPDTNAAEDDYIEDDDTGLRRLLGAS